MSLSQQFWPCRGGRNLSWLWRVLCGTLRGEALPVGAPRSHVCGNGRRQAASGFGRPRMTMTGLAGRPSRRCGATGKAKLQGSVQLAMGRLRRAWRWPCVGARGLRLTGMTLTSSPAFAAIQILNVTDTSASDGFCLSPLTCARKRNVLAYYNKQAVRRFTAQKGSSPRDSSPGA